jgi:hypothetical protein
MTTAPAIANPNLAFINYWGIVTENIAVVTRFCIIFRIQKRGITSIKLKQDNLNKTTDSSTLISGRIFPSLDKVVALDSQLK